MGILATIGTAFKLVFLIVNRWLERDAEKRKKLKEAVDEVKAGIKERDPSKITGGFDKSNRI